MFVGRAFACATHILIIQYNSANNKQTEVETAWKCKKCHKGRPFTQEGGKITKKLKRGANLLCFVLKV